MTLSSDQILEAQRFALFRRSNPRLVPNALHKQLLDRFLIDYPLALYHLQIGYRTT